MNREKDIAAIAEWQDFETAPRDGTRFLALWTKGSRGHEYGVIWWDHSHEWVEASIDNHVGKFEHWMPLPALTVNTSTPGSDLEYNGLAATRMEELERRTLKLELAVSALMEK